MRWLLMGILALVVLVGCRNEDEPALPSIQVATEVVVSTPTTAATPTTPPTQTATVRVWTPEELKRNTVVFKQDTGLALGKPYQGQGFMIQYDGGSVAYYVLIEATSLGRFQVLKNQAEGVFRSAGAKDLCALAIYFPVPKELTSQTNRSDLFATGCPALF